MKKLLLYGALMVAFSFAQGQTTHYFEDFSSASNNAIPSNMTSIDADGDGNDWLTTDYGDGQGNVATSESWQSGTGPLTPDNWLITPAIDLSNASGTISLSWLVKGQDQNWADENYTVYVSTGNTTNDFTSSSTTFNEIVGSSNDEYLVRSLDVSSYAGQSIYVAFRHHNVSDQYRLNIDDISVKTLAPVEVSLESVDINDRGVDGDVVDISGTIKNNGSSTINSVEVTWTDGTNSYTDNITGLSIASYQEYDFTHSDQLSITGGETYNIDVSISVDNDADNTNNEITGSAVFGLMFESDNTVVIEEGTGTWCGWCPRGEIAMNYMYNNYADQGFIGIAVHNNDPMVVTEYDNGSAFTGFPGMHINRSILGAGVSQNNMESAYNQFMDRLALAEMDIADAYITTDSNIKVILVSQFAANLSDEYRYAVVIMEDDVTGTSSGYAQVNYYAGGANGAMGGYENMPDPVPAADMTYNHVGRMLMGGYNGEPGSISSPITANDYNVHEFEEPIAGDIDDPSKLTAVGMIIETATGEIVNANKRKVSTNGPSSVEKLETSNSFNLYPNPTNGNAKLSIVASESDEFNVTVYDVTGKQVMNMPRVAVQQGNNLVQLQTADLNSGMYYVSITSNDGARTVKPLVIE
ncbi:T9SS-dependent choice-of-anchor J family protein [Salibacter sp.]|uniref:T9SS-dependent choice-of-anchor J family protein n=1 Tax=Salibacter sp. TaxID=2010995 RepID=UPI0028701341|nr:choice-of-anchor J domain-containing protein [Salibacter sp.]MDR9486878.1 choice-of-anchor J domain-containing protein [Salibacter sp.]